MATALRVQTVRYGGDTRSLLRMLGSVTAAARGLGDGAAGFELTVAIGDCGGPEGPDALVGEDELAEAREILARARISLDYVAFMTNTGHGAGQNLLAKRPTGSLRTVGERDVLVLLNPDTYLSPNCLATLVGALDDDTVGIADARQIPLEHPKQFDPVTGDTPWASGCLMAMRASVFGALDGFEPAFFLHGDDVDLSWRARLGGLRVRHVPQAAVFHDKRLMMTGFPAPTAEEEYQVVLARLLLGHRAERPDVVDRWLGWAGVHGSALHRQAAMEFLAPASRRDAPRHLPRGARPLLGGGRLGHLLSRGGVCRAPLLSQARLQPRRATGPGASRPTVSPSHGKARTATPWGSSSATPRHGIVLDLGCGYAAIGEVLRDSGWDYVGGDRDTDAVADVVSRGLEGHVIDLAMGEGLAGGSPISSRGDRSAL